ncbi:MAG: sulfotransferase [Arenimonas sp.]|uniref:tetratricopeptide repeat-containing sulfotransferase family protein n=1 Tax=Arenimonas sp. TaxID=1872635 RepID=UPI0025B864ED|nr:sulfotransferase [Arenimonas sp.]MBW8368537.1 sulfotransferase [Arenimonas sp.]
MTDAPPHPAALATRLDHLAALMQRGALADAERGLRQLLAEAPAVAAAHKAMATLALRTGRHPLALEHMHQAAALAPESASLQCELGCLLAHQGQPLPALDYFRRTIDLQPAFADGWYFLGITLARLNRDEEALLPLRRAMALAPGQPRQLESLAQVEFRAGFPDDALPLWQELLRLRPGHDETLLKLGETLGRLGHNLQARQLYVDALEQRPGSADLWMALAQCEEDIGDRDAAASAYERALALRPDWAFPLSGVLGLLRGKAPEPRVAQAKALQARADLPDPDRALIGYELGKVLDGRGEYAAAMASWDDANAARRRMIGEFDLPAQQQRVAQTMAVFDRPLFEQASGGSPDERPVFVVGMPRSGTTLTEQIIGSHAQAHGCGELPDMSLIAHNLPARDGSPQQWPNVIRDLHPGALEQAIQRYLTASTRHAPAGALRLVDKAPMNFHLLGLVALMFPRARVVWCRRDPRDIAVSIYGENFSLSERFATRLEGIGHSINLQNQLMRHWQKVLPLPILELDYEQLVSDIEPQARRLLEFTGLPWDPDCLRFHQSERGVQTPSRWQVRQPVHTRSVGRWKNYAFAMAPLMDVLEPRPRAD